MELTKKNDSLGTQSRDENGKDICHSYDTEDIQDKMKKVDVKTFSPTSLLIRNTLTLPTGVIKPNQREQAKAKIKTMPSSGSATGKNIYNMIFLVLLVLLLNQSRNNNIINILCHIFRESKGIIQKKAHKKCKKYVLNRVI